MNRRQFLQAAATFGVGAVAAVSPLVTVADAMVPWYEDRELVLQLLAQRMDNTLRATVTGYPQRAYDPDRNAIGQVIWI